MRTIDAPQSGQLVRVRQRQYFVEEVAPPGAGDDSTLVRMSCLDDDAQGQPLEVLWEKELDPEIITAEAWQDIAARGFDPPKVFSAYLHTLQWNCVTSTDPTLFQSPFRAGIRIDAYQLEPLRKALRLPRVNLFIADDVGLGKTIEAGLIARELLLRKKVQDIVVACPPSMLFQWQDELEIRFGMVFQILDKDYIARVRRERGYGVNPWTTHTRFLVSHRLLIDEAYTATLRDWLGDFRPGSLLVLDEAHHAAPASGAKYAIDSKFTRAIRDIAGRFEHRLFLSATPHNGHPNSFSALLEILDPQRFCRGVIVRPKLRDEVMVRRLKEDLRAIAGGFPKRTVRQLDIDDLPLDTPELRLSELLDEYRELREQRLKGESKRKQAAAALLISGLQQRLLSSVEAFARTLRVHRRTVKRHWEEAQASKPEPEETPTLPDLFAHGVDSDDDRATLSEEELQAEEDAQIEAATKATTGTLTDLSARELYSREQTVARRDDRDRRGGSWTGRRSHSSACRLDPRAHVSGASASRNPNPARFTGEVERNPGHHLHRVRRHQALPRAATQGGHRVDRPRRSANPRLPRPDAPGRARGDQACLQRRPEEASRPDPHRDRRRARGTQPSDPLLEPLPLRRAVESQPHGAAERSDRPQAPAQGRSLLPLLRLQATHRGPHPQGASCGRPRPSSSNWGAFPRSSRAAWPIPSSTGSAAATSMRWRRNSKRPTSIPR